MKHRPAPPAPPPPRPIGEPWFHYATRRWYILTDCGPVPVT